MSLQDNLSERDRPANQDETCRAILGEIGVGLALIHFSFESATQE
jgi:predicted nuclease of restriction endonuclease-like (RecB) superfamily